MSMTWEASETSEARMVHVEVKNLPPGLRNMVEGRVVNVEQALQFGELYMALRQPQREDFWVLEDTYFVLEIEVQDLEGARAFRAEVEGALNELGADWGTALFDEEDTMSEARMNRTPANWD